MKKHRQDNVSRKAFDALYVCRAPISDNGLRDLPVYLDLENIGTLISTIYLSIMSWDE